MIGRAQDSIWVLRGLNGNAGSRGEQQRSLVITYLLNAGPEQGSCWPLRRPSGLYASHEWVWDTQLYSIVEFTHTQTHTHTSLSRKLGLRRIRHAWKDHLMRDFPGVQWLKILPAMKGDAGELRSHMPQRNCDRVPQLLSLQATTRESVCYSERSHLLELRPEAAK